MNGQQSIHFVCLMLLLGASCSAEDNEPVAINSAAGASAPRSNAEAAEGTLGNPDVQAKLRSLALQASAQSGASSPRTIFAVASPDHQEAQLVLSDSLVSDHEPVYVIVVTGGPFVAARHPPGVPAPEGDVLTLVVDAATYRVVDLGIARAEPDLSKISPVVVDLGAK